MTTIQCLAASVMTRSGNSMMVLALFLPSTDAQISKRARRIKANKKEDKERLVSNA